MKKIILLSMALFFVAGPAGAVPNPAAVYCIELGYAYEIRTDEHGNQYGVCIFPDGSECGAWAYYHKCYVGDAADCHWPCQELPCKHGGQSVFIGECCEGLEVIKPAETYDANCNDLAMVGWVFLCSDCGNGICESWESKCNCPEDCREVRIIYVDDDGTADFNNIQAAINDSNDGDTIIVRDGTYTGDGNRDIDFLGKAITVRSENGPDNCIIDCQGTETEPHRGFYFHNGEDSNSVVDGFTIINGYASSVSPQQLEWSGGGILCRHGSSPTIRNCIITGNTTLNGTGGGIRASGGLITNCTIKGNYAIGLIQSGPGGGGISCGSQATVSNCTISGNTAATSGGGILCSGNATIMNCTIVGNSAGHGGGIGCRFWGDAIISNCTISGNLASSSGGGIRCLDSSPTLVNCILWGNTAAFGPEMSILGLHCPSLLTTSYSNVVGGEGAIDIMGEVTLVWGNGNIDIDPCFVEPGYWDANNTPDDANDDFWVDGDYHLKSQAGRWDAGSQSWVQDDVTSPCIDAGDMGSPIGLEPFPNGGVINMGAYGGTAEASKSYFGTTPCETIVAGDINGDCQVNFWDFALMAFHWLEDNNP